MSSEVKTVSLPLPPREYDPTDQEITRRLLEQTVESISSQIKSIEKVDSNQLSNAIRKKQFLLMGATEQASKLTTTAEIADGAVTSAKLDTNITVSGTLDSTGKLTADAGIDVDNFNIDGTTIALSSGNMTLDVAGSIILNADGGQISFQDDAVEVGVLENSSSDFKIESKVQDKDIIFAGNDGGSGITPLTLDMSEAGEAIFAGNIRQNGGVNVSQNFFMDSGSSQGAFNFTWSTDGSSTEQSVAHMYVQQGSGDGAARKAEFVFQVADNSAPATALTIANNGVVSGNLNDTSDVALKENITDLGSATATLKQLQPRTFDWKQASKGTGVAGFVAQEVASVIPKAVVGNDYSEANKNTGKAINTTSILAYAVKTIQELEARIKTLEDA